MNLSWFLLLASRCSKIIVLSWCNNVQVTKLRMNSLLCNVMIVTNVAIISNSVARWRTMHPVVCKTFVVRCVHWTQSWRFYEIFLVQLKKLKLCVSLYIILSISMSCLKVLKLWPSFKHFNSIRQMASPEWSALCYL